MSLFKNLILNGFEMNPFDRNSLTGCGGLKRKLCGNDIFESPAKRIKLDLNLFLAPNFESGIDGVVDDETVTVNESEMIVAELIRMLIEKSVTGKPESEESLLEHNEPKDDNEPDVIDSGLLMEEAVPLESNKNQFDMFEQDEDIVANMIAIDPSADEAAQRPSLEHDNALVAALLEDLIKNVLLEAKAKAETSDLNDGKMKQLEAEEASNLNVVLSVLEQIDDEGDQHLDAQEQEETGTEQSDICKTCEVLGDFIQDPSETSDNILDTENLVPQTEAEIVEDVATTASEDLKISSAEEDTTTTMEEMNEADLIVDILDDVISSIVAMAHEQGVIEAHDNNDDDVTDGQAADNESECIDSAEDTACVVSSDEETTDDDPEQIVAGVIDLIIEEAMKDPKDSSNDALDGSDCQVVDDDDHVCPDAHIETVECKRNFMLEILESIVTKVIRESHPLCDADNEAIEDNNEANEVHNDADQLQSEVQIGSVKEAVRVANIGANEKRKLPSFEAVKTVSRPAEEDQKSGGRLLRKRTKSNEESVYAEMKKMRRLASDPTEDILKSNLVLRVVLKRLPLPKSVLEAAKFSIPAANEQKKKIASIIAKTGGRIAPRRPTVARASNTKNAKAGLKKVDVCKPNNEVSKSQQRLGLKRPEVIKDAAQKRQEVMTTSTQAVKRPMTASIQKPKQLETAEASSVGPRTPKPATTPKTSAKMATTPKSSAKTASTPKTSAKQPSTPKTSAKPASTPKTSAKLASTSKTSAKPASTPKTSAKPASTPKTSAKPASTPKPTSTPKSSAKPATTPKSSSKPVAKPATTPKSSSKPVAKPVTSNHTAKSIAPKPAPKAAAPKPRTRPNPTATISHSGTTTTLKTVPRSTSTAIVPTLTSTLKPRPSSRTARPSMVMTGATLSQLTSMTPKVVISPIRPALTTTSKASPVSATTLSAPKSRIVATKIKPVTLKPSLGLKSPSVGATIKATTVAVKPRLSSAAPKTAKSNEAARPMVTTMMPSKATRTTTVTRKSSTTQRSATTLTSLPASTRGTSTSSVRPKTTPRSSVATSEAATATSATTAAARAPATPRASVTIERLTTKTAISAKTTAKTTAKAPAKAPAKRPQTENKRRDMSQQISAKKRKMNEADSRLPKRLRIIDASDEEEEDVDDVVDNEAEDSDDDEIQIIKIIDRKTSTTATQTKSKRTTASASEDDEVEVISPAKKQKMSETYNGVASVKLINTKMSKPQTPKMTTVSAPKMTKTQTPKMTKPQAIKMSKTQTPKMSPIPAPKMSKAQAIKMSKSNRKN